MLISNAYITDLYHSSLTRIFSFQKQRCSPQLILCTFDIWWKFPIRERRALKYSEFGWIFYLTHFGHFYQLQGFSSIEISVAAATTLFLAATASRWGNPKINTSSAVCRVRWFLLFCATHAISGSYSYASNPPPHPRRSYDRTTPRAPRGVTATLLFWPRKTPDIAQLNMIVVSVLATILWLL